MNTLTLTTNKKAMKVNGTNYIKITELGVNCLPAEFTMPSQDTPYIMHVKFCKNSKMFTVRTMAEKICLLVEKLTVQQFMGLLQS